MKKLSKDGLPVDPCEWTQDDWRDLHKAMETAKTTIAERHNATESSKKSIAKLANSQANNPRQCLSDCWKKAES